MMTNSLKRGFVVLEWGVGTPPFMRKRYMSEKSHIVLEKVVVSGGTYIISHITNLSPRETPQ